MKDISTNKIETIGDYFAEEKRTQDWGNYFIVNLEHKTLATWINSIIESGLQIEKFIEPMPQEEAKGLFPEKYEIYTKRPGFMIVLCRKSSDLYSIHL